MMYLSVKNNICFRSFSSPGLLVGYLNPQLNFRIAFSYMLCTLVVGVRVIENTIFHFDLGKANRYFELFCS